MKLYYSPGACSLAVHIALRELGQPFDGVAVDLATHRLKDGGDFYAISPRGYVPVLEFDDGARHTEVAALLQFVADRDPAQALIGPVGSPRRLPVTEALAFVATELHKVFSPWLWHKETADSTRAAVRARLAERFAELDRLLAGQDFIAGAYSVADAYAFAILNWVNFLAIPITAYPALQAYLARVAARPAVQAALRAEGLLK
ncbi:MAG: glutathione S-transferase family protein [Piscinibacter sp.]|nr:glutathione S-transferase family protein [Piscinibacter sp.]